MSGHVVIQRTSGTVEVWQPCSDRSCNTYHTKVGDFPDRFAAEKVARLLDQAGEKTAPPGHAFGAHDQLIETPGPL